MHQAHRGSKLYTNFRSVLSRVGFGRACEKNMRVRVNAINMLISDRYCEYW